MEQNSRDKQNCKSELSKYKQDSPSLQLLRTDVTINNSGDQNSSNRHPAQLSIGDGGIEHGLLGERDKRAVQDDEMRI